MADVSPIVAGTAPGGRVGITDFDRGVVETLGGIIVQDNINATGYYLKNIPGINNYTDTTASGGVQAVPGFAGVPIVFSFPEDTFAKYKLPMVMIRRDSIEPAVNRWHPGAQQYVAPKSGAKQISVNIGTSDTPKFVSGYTSYQEMQQAVPYDFTYTVRIISKFRGQTGTTNHTNALLEYVIGIYQPYCRVLVKDSLGYLRSYEAFQDSIGTSDEGFEIADRVLGFDITVRVEGELDINTTSTYEAVTSNPVINLDPQATSVIEVVNATL
jgi:hypothetical protein